VEGVGVGPEQDNHKAGNKDVAALQLWILNLQIENKRHQTSSPGGSKRCNSSPCLAIEVELLVLSPSQLEA
jgi:hypothetical protein